MMVALASCGTDGSDDGAGLGAPRSVPVEQDHQGRDPDGAPPPLADPGDVGDPLPEDEAHPEPVGPTSPQERASGDFPRWEGESIGLADARLVTHDGFDRLVLEFDASLPSWQVRPVSGPIIEQPGRTEVELEGDGYLEIRLVPASSIDRDAAEPLEAYEGPAYLSSDGPGIREAALTGDASELLVWSVGVSTGTPSFAVGTLEAPERLVVDVLAED